MQPKYLPIDPDFFILFENEKNKGIARIVYFGGKMQLEEVNGEIEELIKKSNNEWYMIFDNGEKVRLDRIITYNGKPGPAFDEYDAYALECLSCKAGYEE